MGKKILVMRGNKPYVRDYPSDYEKYHKTKDFSAVHPNKLKTWLIFAKAAQKARGKSLEDVVYAVKQTMSGIKIKEKKQKVYNLSYEEILDLKYQAIRKGIDPRYVDILAGKKQTKKKKYEELLTARSL